MSSASRNKLPHIRKKQILSGAFGPLTTLQKEELMKTMSYDYPRQERAKRYSGYRNALKLFGKSLPNERQLEHLNKQVRKEFMDLIISISHYSDFAEVVINNPNLQNIIESIKDGSNLDLNDLRNIAKLFGCDMSGSISPNLEIPVNSFGGFYIGSLVSLNSYPNNQHFHNIKNGFDGLGSPVEITGITYCCKNPFYCTFTSNHQIPGAKILIKGPKGELELYDGRLVMR